MTAANEAGSSSQTSAAFTVTLLDVVKYYDKNTNGQLDASESTIAAGGFGSEAPRTRRRRA